MKDKTVKQPRAPRVTIAQLQQMLSVANNSIHYHSKRFDDREEIWNERAARVEDLQKECRQAERDRSYAEEKRYLFEKNTLAYFAALVTPSLARDARYMASVLQALVGAPCIANEDQLRAMAPMEFHR